MKLTSLILTEGQREDQMIERVITEILAMSVTSHFWHWQTKSYAAHEALGEFYTKLTEIADQLAESFMGMGGSFNVGVDTHMSSFSVNRAVEELRELKGLLVETVNQLTTQENGAHQGCADIIIDGIKEIDKLRYLLTLD